MQTMEWVISASYKILPILHGEVTNVPNLGT